MSDLRTFARTIFHRALQACDVRAAVARAIRIAPGAITLADRTLPLDELDNILLIAIGKAAVPMHQAALSALGSTFATTSIVVAPPATLPREASTRNTLYLPGDHPTPTTNAFHAARVILDDLARATPRTLVLFLISGGASAMVELPLSPAITLDDLAAFHRALVAAGLPIDAMNALRKHLSAVKGGRLAAAAQHAAAHITLLASDVPPGREDVIASGPTLPDPTTLADCRKLIADLASRPSAPPLPAAVIDVFSSSNTPETLKPGDPAFAHALHSTLLSSRDLAQAAAEAARSLGFHTEIDPISEGTSANPEFDYRDVATHLLNRSAALATIHPLTCLINTGEIAVPLGSNPGEGGRNQQFALYAATELSRRRQPTTVLSAGSDGIDGHSLAAGAICDQTTVARASSLGLDPHEALEQFNTAPLLRALDAQILTGPTGNNLRDLRLILTSASQLA
ncbi:hydroxypyruvate reductase [Bryocella elongata]|uniref:Hydroxypyruvate reductase n=1 Tax=Bryocella elongata TaxID=863522 RepID=A0A1H5Y604_9BACT|nr:DUF4147 domain-containing protein [Bryocella elongata]SEG19358.1 hydroxypyruvate reductase [Bryocella elongata]